MKCPACGSKKISIDSGDDEYYEDSTLFCHTCNLDFEDEYGYINAMQKLEYENWRNSIDLELYFSDPDIHSWAWQKFCEEEILKTIKEK